MKTALIIGSTGLVGNDVLNQLLESDNYDEIISFSRKPSGKTHQKLKEYLVNFEKPETWQSLVKGDVAFSALGTTIKAAGSKENQFKVDYTYQYEFAKACSKNSVGIFVLISSAGANSTSPFFYAKIKGKLEEDIKKLKFNGLNFIQPASLKGNRKIERSGEKISLAIIGFLNNFSILKKYTPIDSYLVAKAAINAVEIYPKTTITISDKAVFELANAR